MRPPFGGGGPRGDDAAQRIPTGETALAALAAGLRPAYFLIGDHALMRSRITERIRELAVPEEWRAMNAETMWADEVPEARAAEAAATPPFGSERRFLLVRGVEAYRGGAAAEESAREAGRDEEGGAEAPDRPVARKRRTKAGKAEASPLVGCLERPSPQTVLVLTSEKRDLKWWTGDALFEAAEEAGAVVACVRPSDPGAWIAQEAAALGARLEPDAADELVERAGADPLQLSRELEKLAAYAGVRGVSTSGETPGVVSTQAVSITAEHVQALTGETASPSVFAYLDALFVERQPARALSLLARLLEDSHPLRLHAMLLTQLRKLVALKGALAAGLTDWQIAGKIKLPFSLVGSLKMMVARTRPERFAALLRALAQAERELKRGREGRAVLEDLTLECCR